MSVLAVSLMALAATLFMTGLNWFVQVVHYPLMAYVGRDEFARYEAAHMRLTTQVVAPAMLVEAGASVALFLMQRNWATGVSIALLAVIWISTAVVQVPAHNALLTGFSEPLLRRLVETNWLRTAAWSSRSAILLWIVFSASRPKA